MWRKNAVALARVIGCLAALTGCQALQVQATVTKTDLLPPSLAGKSFFVLPQENQKGSAEFTSFANLVTQKLATYGLARNMDSTTSDYVVMFTYGVSGSTTTSGSTPLIGQTGGGTSFQSGSVNAFGTGGSAFGSYSGTTYAPPTYGVVGAIPYTVRNFDRFITMNIYDWRASTPQNYVGVYEAKVFSSGSSPTFSQVGNCLFNALFVNFRLTGTRQTEIPMKTCAQ